MKYCNICLQTDTRPGIKFNPKGTCPACSNYFKLKDVDWDERRKELDKVVSFGKQNNHSGYDCIIGVSGGKDSTRQAFFGPPLVLWLVILAIELVFLVPLKTIIIYYANIFFLYLLKGYKQESAIMNIIHINNE